VPPLEAAFLALTTEGDSTAYEEQS
jgi:hypothetical protein